MKLWSFPFTHKCIFPWPTYNVNIDLLSESQSVLSSYDYICLCFCLTCNQCVLCPAQQPSKYYYLAATKTNISAAQLGGLMTEDRLDPVHCSCELIQQQVQAPLSQLKACLKDSLPLQSPKQAFVGRCLTWHLYLRATIAQCVSPMPLRELCFVFSCCHIKFWDY